MNNNKFILFLLLNVLSISLSVHAQQSINVNNVIVNFLNRGSQTDFFLISNLANNINVNNAWLSVGFNNVNKMNGTSAIVCQNNNGISFIQHYYLNGYVPELMNSQNPYIGLSNIQVSVNQGYLVCSFTRDNSNSNPNYYNTNLNNPYVLVSFGSGGFGYHGLNRGVSSEQIKISQVTPQPTTTTTTSTTTTTTSTTTPTTSTTTTTTSTTTTTTSTMTTTTSTMTTTTSTMTTTTSTMTTTTSTMTTTTSTMTTTTSTMTTTNLPTTTKPLTTTTPIGTPFEPTGSYQSPSGAYNVYWNSRASNTSTRFLLQANLTPGNMWLGMSFSTDQLMGNDDAAICKYICVNNSCVGTVQHYYTVGRVAPSFLVANSPQIGFSNIQVSYVNGKLSCAFDRLNSMSTIRNYFDSTIPYYILNANGFTDSAGNIYYHINKEASNKKIDLMLNTFNQTWTTPAPNNNTVTTPFTSVTVIPINVLVNRLTQAINGFLAYLQKFLNGAA